MRNWLRNDDYWRTPVKSWLRAKSENVFQGGAIEKCRSNPSDDGWVFIQAIKRYGWVQVEQRFLGQ